MSHSPIILPFKGIMPRIAPSAFIAAGAVIVGDVEIGENSNIWFGCVLRGDVHEIRVGQNTNIQDGTVVHVTAGGVGVHIGSNVTIGHMALLHDCTLADSCFVGMKSVVMDGAKLETRSMLAAGSLLTSGKTIVTGQLWAGSPAKFWRELNDEEQKVIIERPLHYVELAAAYK